MAKSRLVRISVKCGRADGIVEILLQLSVPSGRTRNRRQIPAADRTVRAGGEDDHREVLGPLVREPEAPR
jgi:hypothetical protein